ncbi:MAG: GNAT family N-acetyltransferase [Dokdonella sp.]
MRQPTVLHSPRLSLRELEGTDADFILELLNEPGWIRFIGDRGVTTLAAAREYIEFGPRQSYTRFGFGLYVVERQHDQQRLGLCGLMQRHSLPEVDLGFAFLERHGGRGYALEAANRVAAQARDELAREQLLAITLPHNSRSINLLGKLGMRFERELPASGDEPELHLFRMDLAAD